MIKGIPKSFKLFGATIKVVCNNDRMNDKRRYGESDYSALLITISNTDGVRQLAEDRIIDTFYHEKVHMILDSMKEHELSNNEKFVDIFAKLLRQADETAIY
jgi:hypothetical protein